MRKLGGIYPLPILFILLSVCGATENCKYGLGDYNPTPEACLALHQKAFARLLRARTICYSANSQVSWNRNNKEPVAAFSTMRAGARIAIRGFTFLSNCQNADLVVRIDYDDMVGTVTLNVKDADSDDTVFNEYRSVSDLSSDVSRMARHFQSMVSDARSAPKKATDEKPAARPRNEVSWMDLPLHWRFVDSCPANVQSNCPDGPFMDVWIKGDILYQDAVTVYTLNDKPIKYEVSCALQPRASEAEPWAGTCTYKIFWGETTTPTCAIKADDTIKSIDRNEIMGRVQGIDLAPLRLNPPICPSLTRNFEPFKLIPLTGGYGAPK